MDTPQPVSVVIRAWNEATALQRLLDALATQDYKGAVELIVVDNGSTDDTSLVAKRAGAKIVHLPQAAFSYPKSLNLGIGAASNELVVEVVAHALPINNHWLTSGLKHFTDPKVVGVYADQIAVPGASLGERILYGNERRNSRRKTHAIKRAGMGVFGATNLIIRRSTWEQHHFDEQYGLGGEDEAWARWALSHGYSLIKEAGFVVYHSHNIKTTDLVKQWLHWHSTRKPLPFDQAVIRKFRPDIVRRSSTSNQARHRRRK